MKHNAEVGLFTKPSILIFEKPIEFRLAAWMC